MLGAALSARDFTWLIGSLCQLNRLPFDASLILQRFPAPHTGRQFLEALQSLGFKTGEYALGPGSFDGKPGGVRLPCVGFLKAQPTAEGGETLRPAILIKADAERLLVVANIALRQAIAQPVPSRPQQCDLIRAEPDFFLQFPVHRLLRRLVSVDTTLRKLPRGHADPTTAKDLPPVIEQDDADV